MKITKGMLGNIALISQIGISMITPIIVCVLLGNYLDKKLNTGILFLIIFTILGVGTSFLSLYKLTMEKSNKKRK